MAKSFLTEFASRLNVKVGTQELEETQAQVAETEEASRAAAEEVSRVQASQNEHPATSVADGTQVNVPTQKSFVQSQQPLNSVVVQSQAKETSKKPSMDDFNLEDPKLFQKQLKNLAQVTPNDIQMHKRQKNGQLRIGDVICLSFLEEIHNEQMKREQFSLAYNSMAKNAYEFKKKEKSQRVLDDPDFKYKGLLYSDGVTDIGVKVLPKRNEMTNNASSLFKQCLFRLEIKQGCDVNTKGHELRAELTELRIKLYKIIEESGGEDNVNQKVLQDLKNDIDNLEKQIEVNNLKKIAQDDNNQYEQGLQVGKKITYGQSVQLKHIFSGKYLTINFKQMSQEYGCCQMFLSETTKESWFTIEPTYNLIKRGQVINYKDFFQIKSLTSSTPFYLHVFKKPTEEYSDNKYFILNASQRASSLKAKLFMSYMDSEKEKEYIQSGDVIRIKHLEANGYLTSSSLFIDEILPSVPDFLRGQIQRMNRGEKIELPKGGKEKSSMSAHELLEINNDNQAFKFEYVVVNDEYVKTLKSNAKENVYIESKDSRLMFTNSCWEIQRVNAFKGGNCILDEVYRLRHVGTGKYLAISDDRSELVLRMTANSLSTLFIFKSEMQTKVECKYIDKDDPEVYIDPTQNLKPGQNLMIMSYFEQKYLQLFEDVESKNFSQFHHNLDHIDDNFTSLHDQKQTQLRIINNYFQDILKHKMLFRIEEVSEEEALYTYKSGCIFDELLEFYAFLNVWGVSVVEQDDSIEKYYLNHEKAIDLTDELFDKCEKVKYILNNIDDLIKDSEKNDVSLFKCKNELVEQGILDMLCRIIEMLYYKTTPTPLFYKPFKVRKQITQAEREQAAKTATGLEDKEEEVDIHLVKVEIYVAQEIAREQTHEVQMKIFQIIRELIRAHRKNSELATKYFGQFYQHLEINQVYLEITLLNKSFYAENCRAFVDIVGEIFRRTQKNSIYVSGDRSSNAIIEYHRKKNLKAKQNVVSVKPRRGNQNPQQLFAVDSKAAIENIEKSTNTNQVQKWLDLLQPVMFLNENEQNIDKMIMYLNVISMFCRNKEGEGVYPYQMQVVQSIFEREENIPLKFGTAKVGNVLRPFVYFVRPKASMSVGKFIKNNPILGEMTDNFKMTQTTQTEFELIFDMHELSKSYDLKGKETWPYVDYISTVINFYAHMCLSCNLRAIKCIQETGIDESHILCCISQDNERLVIHEKLKQAYMFLTRVMHIKNDPISPGISNKNRCYIWERLKEDKGNELKEEAYFNENSDDDIVVENDFYHGLRRKRKYQMDDPNNSMIVLRHEQQTKDLGLIRLIKKEVLWFLQLGPAGSDAFFYHHQKRTFLQENLKTKIKSLKIYLDTLYALISEDCVDAQFIQNVMYICQCAIMGSKYMTPEQEMNIPPMVKGTWVYILMWLSRDIIAKQAMNRQVKNAIKAVEIKVLNILDKITDYRLNLQLHLFLMKFRKFQENNLDPHVSNEKSLDLHLEFQSLFDIHQFDTGFKISDIFIYQRIHEVSNMENFILAQQPNNKLRNEISDFDQQDINDYRLNKKVPFDLFLMDYIFSNESSHDVRNLSLQVIIKNFNQRDNLIRELARTDLIVSKDDYEIYYKFLQQQRQIKMLTNKLIQDEMFHMVYNKSPSLETKNTKIDIINILLSMQQILQAADEIQLKKLQNMIRHINLIDDLVNVLLKRLIFKEIQYQDLFQTVVDFLFVICYQNANCQKYMLPELNFFLDMMSQRIETGMLISEVIKSNTDMEYSKNFIRYLINKIFKEGYYKSSLFKQLIRMADNIQESQDEERETTYDDQRPENSNQQFILKQIIKNEKFRVLLLMKREFTQMKLGVIKTYCKKKEQYNLSKKEEDANLRQDRESLELHLSIVDLVAACARNSPFGIAQAQKLIDVEELLESILSDAIPYLVKKHYFNLLFEIYLRKVPGLQQTNRLQINDIKFVQIMKWVVLFDFQHCYNYYTGVITEQSYQDPPEIIRKVKQVIREVERASEKEYDDLNSGKTEKDKDDERKYKASLSTFNSQAFFVLDTNDQSEFWRYMYEYNKAERTYDGLLCFIERFYRDYDVQDIQDDDMQDITVKIRDRLLAIANQIFLFIEAHEGFIKSDIFDLLREINKTVQRIPHIRAFRAGIKRVVKDGKIVVADKNDDDVEDADLADESRDLDNRMCGEKIIRILRDYIMKENLHIKGAFGIDDITTDHYIDRDKLKDQIKAITGAESSFEEIMKALDHFQKVAGDKKKEKKAMEVDKPGSEGYIMNRYDGAGQNIVDLIRQNKMNFRDLEVQLKDVLKKQGYKAPNQQRERGGEAFEALMPNITEKDLSIMINIDLKLFTQRFFEFAHMTKNVSEIHDFVNKLMMDEDINATKEAQVQLIENLCSCFTGLQGIDDELVLISLLTIMLQRLMPEKDELVEMQETEIQKTIFRKKNEELKQKLRMTQEIMFDAKVPQLMLSFINTQHDNFLANKALNLLNCMMFKASEQMQRKILAFLKKDDLYFSVFYYVKQRLDISKTYLLQKIKINAKQKFVDSRMKPKEGQMSLSNDFKNQKIYMSQKFDLEFKYEELQIIWKQEEITILLSFLNAMCEGCFRDSQLYLRSQIDDQVENFKDNKQGKITSIDLIYQTVTQFIDIVESLGKFVFSDFRTYKLIPFLLDTIIEFIYGPNIENQMFLGRWKKLIQKIDFLMQLDDMGNYSGIHQEAKAQLKILFACSNILLAIIDIKDKEKATEIHKIVLGEIDVENLMSKMVDIYLFKIGGSKEKKEIYKFSKICNHYKNRQLKEGDNHCIEDEFCQHGHLIPRDRETIQTGFNIFQILQILRRSLPNHPKLNILQIDQQKYDFLWKDYDYYFKHIFLEISRSYMAKPMFDRYMGFDCNSKKLLDQLIIKCFPDTYIKYLEVIAKGSQEDDAKKQALLLQVINMSKQKKSLDDQSKMLQKVQQKIHEEIEKEVHRKEYEKLIGELDTHGDEEDDHDPLINGPVGYAPLIDDAPKKSIFSKLKKTQDKDESKIKQDRKTLMLEFQEKLRVFKYYLACDFYEDNIGHVEILQGDEIIEATFMMPSIVHLLPPISRKKIPRIIFKVSQQEKLEAFMSNVPLLREEMIWQQRLGQFSGSVKMFANRYFELSYVNFTMICLVNILFMQTLRYDEIGLIQFESSWQRPVVEGISTIQTSIAFIVMFSYYLESRAKFVYLIKQLDSSSTKQTRGVRAVFEKIKSLLIKTGNVVVKPPEEGMNKGSQGFGLKKAEKHVNIMQNLSVITSIVKLSQNNIIVEWSLYLAAEIVTFVRSIFIDYDHALHCLYVFISILSIGNNFFNAVLLIDIIKKIPSLKDIINILEENLHQIIPTLALFLVALYIFAFYAFNNFDDAFESDPDPGSDHAAGFQMYCDTLANCLLSTVNVGIRSGGGLGENLSQVDYFDDLYVTRYVFDMAFFLIINIVLLNIFFGIIIDAFADKRAINTEQDSEMVNQCFICGVSKSRFDIENIPWKEHIYKQHNMHSYLAFVLYVQSKPTSECTGVEKWVKQRIQSNNVDFFPVNRCLAIKGGQVLE